MMNGTQKQYLTKEEKRHQLNRLKEAIDAEQLLEALGFHISMRGRNEIRAACILHGGKNKSSFRMNRNTKNWVCFSAQCHETIGYDVISLVMHVLELSFREAVKYLESISGVNIYDEKAYVEFKRNKDRTDFINRSKDNRQVPSALVTEQYLKSFKKFRSDFFEKRGFDKELLDEFEIGGGYVDKYGLQRDVIPIKDVNGILVGYSCRDITGKAEYDYKYLLTKGFKKDAVLYNLHRAKNESRTIIVVEGFKSVWRLQQAGYKNAVCCMGSRVTQGQQNLLYGNAHEVVLLLDGDEAGVKGTGRAIKDMKGKIKLVPIIFPYEDKDPADIDIEELKQIIGGYNG